MKANLAFELRITFEPCFSIRRFKRICGLACVFFQSLRFKGGESSSQFQWFTIAKIEL